MAVQVSPVEANQRSWSEVLWLGAALLLACVALWPTLAGDYVYDDRILVQQNPTIRSLEGLRSSWSAAYWDFLQPETAKQLGYWRPLTALALHLGWRLGDGEPGAFHALSLALHLLAVGAVFHLARRLARSAAVGGFAALLFAAHPVQVEPVAWISSVNDPLYGAAVLWGLVAYLRWRELGSRGIPIVAAVCFAIGLLAKENAVAFLPLALALDLGRVPREHGDAARRGRWAGLRPTVRAYGTLLGLIGLWWLARVAVFGEWSAGVGRVTTVLNIEGTDRLWLRAELFGGFLSLLAWPVDLNLFREIDPVLPRFGDWGFLASLGCALAWLAALVAAFAARARPALAGLLIAAAGVAPALVRFESLGRFVLSDRFLYVSVAGFAFLLAWLAWRWLPKPLACGLLGLFALGATLLSRDRGLDWRDEESLFRATVASSPDSVYARWGLGRVLIERFQATGDARLLDEAQAAFERVQDQISPRDTGRPSPHLFYTLDDLLQANCGVGWSFLMRATFDPDYGFDEAELVFGATRERFPHAVEPLVGLGVARMHRSNLEGAEEALQAAMATDPSHPPAWFNLGQVAVRRGDWKAAAERFERVLELLPQDAAAQLWLGTALVEGGLDAKRAKEVLLTARDALPGDANPSLQLGALDARAGNWREALRWFDEVLRIDPQHARAQLFRAKVLLQLGETENALTALAAACRLDPDSFEAHFLAGRLLAERGFGDAARPYLERALELQPEGPYAAELRAVLGAMPPAQSPSPQGNEPK
jgi:tetratricopeptide (TPR) repeat protein